jgi:hypothetical protein
VKLDTELSIDKLEAAKIEEEINELSLLLKAHNAAEKKDSETRRVRDLKANKVQLSFRATKLTNLICRAKSLRSARAQHLKHCSSTEDTDHNCLAQ